MAWQSLLLIAFGLLAGHPSDATPTKIKAMDLPSEVERTADGFYDPANLDEDEFQQPHDQAEEDRINGQLPEKIYVTTKVYYNRPFADQVATYPEMGATPEHAVKSIVDAANELFGQEGLGTRIVISVRDVAFVGGDEASLWVAKEYLLDEVGKRHIKSSSVNHHTFFTVDPKGVQNGHRGLAFYDTVCTSDPDHLYEKSSIVEVAGSVRHAGQDLAHEVGHALGLRHDYISGSATDRVSDKGMNCGGETNIMTSGVDLKNSWSDCSLEDLDKAWRKELLSCLAKEEPKSTWTPGTPVKPTKKPDPNNGCENGLPGMCINYAIGDAACQTRYIWENCRKTCVRCTNVPCKDKFPGCVKADPNGLYCKTKLGAKNCRKSCGYCESEGPTTKPATRRVPTTITEEPATTGSCEDKWQNCAYATNKRCIDDQYTRQNCRKTCISCVEGECVDKMECKQGPKLKEDCKKIKILRSLCSKSCGVCG